MPSLFGWLDKFNLWNNLSYVQKGTILRALKAAASAIVGVLLGAVTDGTLLPAGSSAITTIVVTAALQAVDKFIREWSDAKDLEPEEKAALDDAAKVETDATIPAEDKTDTTVPEDQ